MSFQKGKLEAGLEAWVLVFGKGMKGKGMEGDVSLLAHLSGYKFQINRIPQVSLHLWGYGL